MKREFEVFDHGQFINVDESFEVIFTNRFRSIVDRSEDWIYFIGQQYEGESFLYRIKKRINSL